MKKYLLLIIILHLVFADTKAQLNDLFQIALENNLSLKNQQIQRELAGLTTKIADLNAFSPRIPVSYQAQDNLNLQSFYVPGAIFGMPEGTYKEMIMGRQYAATFSVSPQLDLYNAGQLSRKKSAALAEIEAELQEKVTQRDLFLKINATYHNILSLNKQQEVLEENLTTATKILDIIKDRQGEGIARTQEVNAAEINKILIEENINQARQNVDIQWMMLKTLTGASDLSNIQIVEDLEAIRPDVALNYGNLDREVYEINRRMAVQELQTSKKEQWPVISAYSSFNWQNLSDSFFYGKESNALNFSYIGLRINWDLPTNASKYSNIKTRETQLKIAENNIKLSEEQKAYEDMERFSDLKKAQSCWESGKKIVALRKDSFDKDFNRFEEGILPLDQLLKTQNEWLQSRLDQAVNAGELKYRQEILRINSLF